MDKLLNLLLDKKRELTNGLVETPAHTLHDYHRRIGEVQGIDIAIELIREIISPDEDDS